MSMSESTHTGAAAVEHKDEAVPAWAQRLQQEVKEVKAENERLRTRVDELEQTAETNEKKIERGNRASVELEQDIEYVQNLAWDIEDVVTGEYSLNLAHDDIDQFGGVLDRVEKLELGEVDPNDVIMTGGAEPELPIEETVGKVFSDILDDPSANKTRAAFVFRAFGGRARSVNGKMILESGDVKNILEDPEKCGISEPNPNTVRRTMDQCAKLTSKKSKRERDHTDPENLLTVEKRNGRRSLVANRDEWQEYTEGVQERING